MTAELAGNPNNTTIAERLDAARAVMVAIRSEPCATCGHPYYEHALSGLASKCNHATPWRPADPKLCRCRSFVEADAVLALLGVANTGSET